jgi:hypothetical protein
MMLELALRHVGLESVSEQSARDFLATRQLGLCSNGGQP